LRITVADAEPEFCDFLEDLLPRIGHEVVAVVRTGAQLMEQCHLTLPDLILTDILLPDMDGIEASALVNRERPVPTVLVSALHSADLDARARAHHIMGYLLKPVKPADVAAAIQMARIRFDHSSQARDRVPGSRWMAQDRGVFQASLV
jgi:response regulator NasT